MNDALVSLRESANGEQAEAEQVAAAKKALDLAKIRYDAGYPVTWRCWTRTYGQRGATQLYRDLPNPG